MGFSRPSSSHTSSLLANSQGLRLHICSSPDLSAWLRPLQAGLITFVSSLGVKKVFCNHLGRNGAGIPDIGSSTLRGDGGEVWNKVTLMEH